MRQQVADLIRAAFDGVRQPADVFMNHLYRDAADSRLPDFGQHLEPSDTDGGFNGAAGTCPRKWLPAAGGFEAFPAAPYRSHAPSLPRRKNRILPDLALD